MTTTFKVVEFYRNNSLTTGSESTTSTNNGALVAESASSDQTNVIQTTFGFSVLGGYSTDLPITILEVVSQANGKTVKVNKFLSQDHLKFKKNNFFCFY